MLTLLLPDEEATSHLGACLWQTLPSKCLVFLDGDLGMGKTTLVRGLLRAAGFTGNVKSPTYNVVEEYHLAQHQVFHFDLYRLNDPEELEWLGMRDYLAQDSLCFIEWPERGAGYLPLPDLQINLSSRDNGRIAQVLINNPQLSTLTPQLQHLTADAQHPPQT